MINAARTTPPNGPAGINTNIEKLRVLCLHGFRTNSHILHLQIDLSVLSTPAVRKYVDFVCVDAPHRTEDERKVPAVIREVFGNRQKNGYREWWNRDDDGNLNGKEESMAFLKGKLDIGRTSSFDGILGFSQGGAVSLLFLQELSDDYAAAQLGAATAGAPRASTAHDKCARLCSRVKPDRRVEPRAGPRTRPVGPPLEYKQLPKFAVILSSFAPRGFNMDTASCSSSLPNGPNGPYVSSDSDSCREDYESFVDSSAEEPAQLPRPPSSCPAPPPPPPRKYNIRKLPLLFMGQRDDKDIPLSRMKSMQRVFPDSVLVENSEGGHKIVPPHQCSAENTEKLARFFRERWEEKFGKKWVEGDLEGGEEVVKSKI
eukprot:g10480.t1